MHTTPRPMPPSPTFRRRAVRAALLCTAAAVAQAGDALVESADVPITDGDASGAAAVGDLTGDGVPEFATGHPSAKGNGATTRGLVSVRDGATGVELFRMWPEPGDPVNNGWGIFLTLVGDLDGDDVRELAVSDVGAGQLGRPPGYVDLISLPTRTRIRRLSGVVSGGSFGIAVADLGDVDGDGVPDLVIGEPGSQPEPGGAAWVFSGATGARLDDRSLHDTPGDGHLGTAVAAAGDLDGDGVRDYVAGAPGSIFTSDRRGRVVLRSGRPGGFQVEVKGSAKFPEFLGRAVAVGDLDGDGRPEIVAAGGGAQGVPGDEFLRVFTLRVSRGRVRARRALDVPNLDGGLLFGAHLAVLPDVDGRPGGELFVVSENRFSVYSVATSGPSVFSTYAAPADAALAYGAFPAYDYGRDSVSGADLSPDGNPDVLVLAGSAAFGGGRVRAIALPPRVAQLPLKLKQRLPFQPAAAAPGRPAAGQLATVLRNGQAGFDFTFSRLPSAGPHTLHVEDAAGAGTFRAIGSFAGTSGRISLAAAGVLPPELGASDVALLGGRAIELRDAAGATVLATVLPYPSQPQSSKQPLALAADPAGPAPGLNVASKLSVDLNRGTSSYTLSVKGAPKGAALSLWGETSPGSGNFAKIGDLPGGSLRLDPKSFAAAFPRIDVPTLVRRVLQVRDANDIVYAGTAIQATPAGPLPDLRIPRVSLRYIPPPIDAFALRVNLANRGAADSGPVNAAAVVEFVTSGNSLTRTATLRTLDPLPVGSVLENVPFELIDNPFPGRHPTVLTDVTVDPAPAGSWGEVRESDESNNRKFPCFIWQRVTDDDGNPLLDGNGDPIFDYEQYPAGDEGCNSR